MDKVKVIATAAVTAALGALVYMIGKKETLKEACMASHQRFFMDNKAFLEMNRDINEPYGSVLSDGKNNRIYSKHCKIGCDVKKTRLNNNCLVVGGPGSGKTTGILKENILCGNSSFVIIDAGGALYQKTKDFLTDAGYRISVLDLCHTQTSNTYNPMSYVSCLKDVQDMAALLTDSLRRENPKEAAETMECAQLLFKALTMYLVSTQKADTQNFGALASLLNQIEKKPDYLDVLVRDVGYDEKKSGSFEFYEKFMEYPYENRYKAILLLRQYFAYYEEGEHSSKFSTDTMNIGQIGDQKTAVFILLPPAGQQALDIASLFITQAIAVSERQMDERYEGDHGAHPITFYLDEFGALPRIPCLAAQMTIMSQYQMSCMIFVQSMEQIKKLYRKEYKMILNGCDIWVYLSSMVLGSANEFVKQLIENMSMTNEPGFNHLSHQEILTKFTSLKHGECIVAINGRKLIKDQICPDRQI